MTDPQEDKPEEVEARMLSGLDRALKTSATPHKLAKTRLPLEKPE